MYDDDIHHDTSVRLDTHGRYDSANKMITRSDNLHHDDTHLDDIYHDELHHDELHQSTP